MKNQSNISEREWKSTIKVLEKLGLNVGRLHLKRLMIRPEHKKAVQDAFTGERFFSFDFGKAQDILGDDFIAPDEISLSRNLSYSFAQIKNLERTFPDEDFLKWCKMRKYMLLPGPPVAMSFLQVYKLNESIFTKSPTSYEEWFPEYQFIQNDIVASAKWLAICKEPVSRSLGKIWDDQLKALLRIEYVPNAAETIWALTSFTEVRGEYPARHVHFRTSSVGKFAHHVAQIESSAHGGFSVCCLPRDEARLDNVGISSGRKLAA